MRYVNIDLKAFRQKVKIRYPVLTFVAISIVLLTPYFLPYNADFVPINSYASDDENGHSIIFDDLIENFNVIQENVDITTYSASSTSVIIITAPQKDFTDKELKFLYNWMDQGGYLILGGLSDDIVSFISLYQNTQSFFRERLVDFQSNYSIPNFIDIQVDGSQFVSISPLLMRVDINIIGTNYIKTTSTTEKVSCVENRGEGCEDSFSIGFINPQQRLAVYLDDWLIRNKYVSEFPENKKFLSTIINELDENIDTVIIDESHYRWAPVNRDGVLVLIKDLAESSIYTILIFIFSIIIPIFLGLMSGMFSRDPEDKLSKITRKLIERVDQLYLDKIIAVPLSLEEQLLVEEKLELISRSKFYFQYVARSYLNLIEKKNLYKYLTNEIILSLEFMENEVIARQQAWEIIKIINFQIEMALKKVKEERRNSEFSISVSSR